MWDPLDQSGISTTCDGPHVTPDTHVGLVACGCPRGWLGCSVRCLALSLACPSTTDFARICGCRRASLEKCTGTFLAVSTFECSPTQSSLLCHAPGGDKRKMTPSSSSLTCSRRMAGKIELMHLICRIPCHAGQGGQVRTHAEGG